MTGSWGLLMPLLCAMLIGTNSCRKTSNEQIALPSFKENILMGEITKWGDNMNNSFAKPVKFRYDKAQKTFFNNNFYIRVPVDSSTGYFYFIKTQERLQPLFIRYHASGILDDGWAEFIDFDSKKFYKVLTYSNGRPVKQYNLS